MICYKTNKSPTQKRRALKWALKAARKNLGEKHPETIAIKINLADTCKATREYCLAIELYLDVLAVEKEILGENNVYVLDILKKVADSMLAMGYFVGAKKLFYKLLRQYEQCEELSNEEKRKRIKGVMENIGYLRDFACVDGAHMRLYVDYKLKPCEEL